MAFFNFTYPTGRQSPPRRFWSSSASSDVGPFGTNQSQLEDLDPAATLPFSSLPKKSSPMRIQTVKQYEEQLSSLSKENFSLKLRIYFMEEKITKLLKGPQDIEEALKNNIQLSVDNETIQKELKENKSLLSQALKALDLIEQEQIKAESLKDSEIKFYKSRIEELEQILQNVPIKPNDKLNEENQLLRKQLEKLEREIENSNDTETIERIEKDYLLKTEECHRLQEEIYKKTNEFKRNQEKFEQLNERITYLERKQATKDDEIRSLNRILDDKCQRLDEMTRQNTELQKVTETQTKLIDSLKSNLLNREKKCGDLEMRLSKELGHSRTLESKLEKQQKKSSDNEDIKLLEEQIVTQEKRFNDLKIENDRALMVIREFMKRDKTDLPEEIQKRDREIQTLKKHIKVLKETFVVRPNEFRKSAGGETPTSEPQRDNNREYESMESQNDESNQIATPKSTLISKYLQQITEMQEQLKEYLYEIQEKDQLIEQYEKNTQETEISLKVKDNQIAELQSKLQQQIENRDKKIEHLETELRKRTGNLQELVNTELWNKNREIERLQIRNNNTSLNGSGDSQEICELQHKNTQLQQELSKLKNNYANCCKSKQEALDMCGLLTTRLEELALFLNALLEQKCVLGLLGIEKQNELKDVIENSLDLSRKLSISFNKNSLLQLSSITDLLDTTRKSLANDLFDFTPIDPLHITTKSNILEQSESEAYSEPDRSVSKARIGIKQSMSPKRSDSSSEEEIVKTTPKSAKRSLFSSNDSKTTPTKELFKLQQKLQEKVNEMLRMERDLLEKDNQLQQFKLDYQHFKQEQTKYKDLEIEMKHADEQREAFELKLANITETVDELLREKTKLQIDLENEVKKSTNLNTEKMKLKDIFDKLQLDYCEANSKLQESTMKLQFYKTHFISKDSYNVTLLSLQQAEKQLEDYKLALQETEYKIQIFQENETKMINRLQELITKTKEVEDESNKKITDLEMEKSQLELQISKLEVLNTDLENQLIKAQDVSKTSSSGTLVVENDKKPSYSGYSSEDIGEVQQQVWLPEDINERTVNSSPDLGIESDQGRFSSLETNNQLIRPFLPPLQLTQTMSSILTNITSNDETMSEIQKLRDENTLLKSKLLKTRKTLEDTVQQLTKSNERKKQVEKAVCKQIHKTSLVLRKARANLDSGSDYDNANSIQNVPKS